MAGGKSDNRFLVARISAALKQYVEEQRQKAPDGWATHKAINCSQRLWWAPTR